MTNNKPVIELEGYRITSVDFTGYDTLEELEELHLSSGKISASVTIDSEIENARLKKMYADECLKSNILQDAMSKKW